MENTITLAILSPQTVVWEGAVQSITGENADGVFDILPDHARFLTVVSGTPLSIVAADGTEAVHTFPSAVLFFADNVAKIYTHEPMTVAGA